jgi:two-component sensor histidine kinase
VVLDIRTILLFQTVVGALIAAIMLGMRREERIGIRGLGWWTGFFAAITAGQLLVGLRGLIPYSLTMVPANLLIAGGFLSLYYGFRAFLGVKIGPGFALALLPAYAAIYFYFGHIDVRLLPRVAALNVLTVIVSGATIQLLRRSAPPELRRDSRTIGLIMAGFIFFALSRLAQAFIAPPGSDAAAALPWDGLNVFAVSALLLVLAFALIKLVNTRLRARIAQHVEQSYLLMREMHHRTKNDFGLIASLISLEAGEADSEQAAGILRRLQDRVQSFALLHERLSGHRQKGSIEAGEYVGQVAAGLVEAAAPDGRIDIEVRTVQIELPATDAVALGLIVNELVTNSLKHGFADGRPGKLELSLKRDERRGRLELRDDGRCAGGIENGRNGKSLGGTLVNLLVEQLGGSIERAALPERGTRVSVDFVIKD